MDSIYYKVIGGHGYSGGLDRRSKYCINYNAVTLKSNTIKAKEGTVGIMAFDTVENAKNFIFKLPIFKCHIIIRVKAVGKPLESPEFICNIIDSRDDWAIDRFYGKRPGKYAKRQPPKGTVFLSALERVDNDLVFTRNG